MCHKTPKIHDKYCEAVTDRRKWRRCININIGFPHVERKAACPYYVPGYQNDEQLATVPRFTHSLRIGPKASLPSSRPPRPHHPLHDRRTRTYLASLHGAQKYFHAKSKQSYDM